MSELSAFPDVDNPEIGDYEYGGRHFHVAAMPEYVHDVFKVKLCIPADEHGDDFERYLGYLEMGPAGWSVVSSQSLIPGTRHESRPLRSWQDALLTWY